MRPPIACPTHGLFSLWLCSPVPAPNTVLALPNPCILLPLSLHHAPSPTWSLLPLLSLSLSSGSDWDTGYMLAPVPTWGGNNNCRNSRSGLGLEIRSRAATTTASWMDGSEASMFSKLLHRPRARTSGKWWQGSEGRCHQRAEVQQARWHRAEVVGAEAGAGAGQNLWSGLGLVLETQQPPSPTLTPHLNRR